MRLLGGVSILLAAAVSLVQPRGARAADDGRSSAAHFQNGVELYSEGNVAGAVAEFRRAYELSKNWKILFNLGQASYELRDYAAALRWFSLYLRDGGQEVAAERRRSIEADIANLRRRVGTISVVSNVPGAEVSVDGRLVGVAPLADLTVNVGEHRVVASKPGWESASRTVVIAMHDRVDVRLDLRALPPPDASSGTPPGARAGTSVRQGPRVWPYFAAAGLALGAGATFGMRALANKAALDLQCPMGRCPATAEPTYSSMSRNATIATIGFATALVGAGLGTFLWLRGDARGPGAAAPTFAVDPGGARGLRLAF
jgi:hypothetical protein